jgi:cyclic pyranopterin phosphate synthase
LKSHVSMVDVTPKPTMLREASAEGKIKLKHETVKLIKAGRVEKGNPLEVAKLAGILAAKNTSQIIPLCHPLPLSHVDINVTVSGRDTVKAVASVKTEAKTGVEMEALTGAATALLTVWDMVKMYEKDRQGQYPTTEILNIKVRKKVKKKL